METSGRVRRFQPPGVEPGIGAAHEAERASPLRNWRQAFSSARRSAGVAVGDQFDGRVGGSESGPRGETVNDGLAPGRIGEVLRRESEVDMVPAAERGQLRGRRAEGLLCGLDSQHDDAVFQRKSFIQPFARATTIGSPCQSIAKGCSA